MPPLLWSFEKATKTLVAYSRYTDDENVQLSHRIVHTPKGGFKLKSDTALIPTTGKTVFTTLAGALAACQSVEDEE